MHGFASSWTRSPATDAESSTSPAQVQHKSSRSEVAPNRTHHEVTFVCSLLLLSCCGGGGGRCGRVCCGRGLCLLRLRAGRLRVRHGIRGHLLRESLRLDAQFGGRSRQGRPATKPQVITPSCSRQDQQGRSASQSRLKPDQVSSSIISNQEMAPAHLNRNATGGAAEDR